MIAKSVVKYWLPTIQTFCKLYSPHFLSTLYTFTILKEYPYPATEMTISIAKWNELSWPDLRLLIWDPKWSFMITYTNI